MPEPVANDLGQTEGSLKKTLLRCSGVSGHHIL